jgi:hypothetical protein
MNVTVLLGDRPIGTSCLEHFAPGMGVASGRFRPLPAYGAVRPLFRRFFDAAEDASTNVLRAGELASFYTERDSLPLRVEDTAGVPVPASTIHVYDYADVAGEDEGYELEVILSQADARFATAILYRPVGQAELNLIEQGEWKAFPPRLEHQPIFYPVLTEDYAVQIARDWNTKDAASGYVGYVTRFTVDRTFLSRYPLQRAGSKEHLEYWIPAEELEEFNRHIIGRIEVVAGYRSEHSPPLKWR